MRQKLVFGGAGVTLLFLSLTGFYFFQKPKAVPVPKKEVPQVVVAPQAGFILEASSSAYVVGNEIRVTVLAKAETDAANLFVAKLRFPSDLLEATKIDLHPKSGNSFVASWFVANWVENIFDNQAGVVSLVGGVPSPGFLSPEGVSSPMADIVFKAKKEGKVELGVENTSAVYRNKDNENVINLREGASFEIFPALPDTTPIPALPQEGDINDDGKVDLVDLSVMMSKWGEVGKSLGKADLREDQTINSFDYAKMVKILLNLQVIKSQEDIPLELRPPTEGTPSGEN